MRSLSWWARLLAAFVVLSLACDNSDAQIVYTRPSKGKAISALDRVQSGQTAAYDWTAFDAAALTVTVHCPGVLTVFSEVEVTGAYSLADTFTGGKVGPRYRQAWSDVCAGTEDISHTFLLSHLPSYVKMGIAVSDTGGQASLGSLVVQPLPFAESLTVRGDFTDGEAVDGVVQPLVVAGYTGGAVKSLRVTNEGRLVIAGNSTTGVAATACSVTSAATRCYVASSGVCAIDVVNRSTTDVYCSQTDSVTSSTGLPINAAASAGKAGGSYTMDRYGGDLWCVTASGSATVNVQPRACP